MAVRLKARHSLSGFLVRQFGCVEVELSELCVFVHFFHKNKISSLTSRMDIHCDSFFVVSQHI